MKTISLRLNDEDNKLIRNFAKINNLNLSEFIRNTLIDTIENSLKLDEERIRKAREKIKTEKTISSEDVWKELGV